MANYASTESYGSEVKRLAQKKNMSVPEYQKWVVADQARRQSQSQASNQRSQQTKRK